MIRDRFTQKHYYVTARAGQLITVVLASPRKDIDACIFLPERNDDLCGQRKYSFRAHMDGDYVIMIDGHRENIPFTLTVSIK